MKTITLPFQKVENPISYDQVQQIKNGQNQMENEKSHTIEIMQNGKISVYYSSMFDFIDLHIPASCLKQTVVEMIERNEIKGFYHNSFGEIRGIKNNGEQLFESELFNSK